MMLALTMGLGIWQVERLEWKRGLLASIDQGEAVAPVPLPPSPVPFSRVVVAGRFDSGIVRYGSEVRTDAAGPVIGSHVVGVLDRGSEAPVVVDLGWAPDSWHGSLPAGPIRVEGYVRPPEHTPWLGTADDPAHRRFFALDPIAIGAALGQLHVAEFTVVALGPAAGLPEPVQALPRPPNDHLTYAITWFSLAAALAVVFGLFVRQTIQQRS